MFNNPSLCSAQGLRIHRCVGEPFREPHLSWPEMLIHVEDSACKRGSCAWVAVRGIAFAPHLWDH